MTRVRGAVGADASVERPAGETPLPTAAEMEDWKRVFDGFGCSRGEGAAYLDAHFERYRATLDLIERDGVGRVLELGGSFPYAFSLMLCRELPQAELFLGNYEELPGEHVIPLRNAETGEEVRLRSRSFNVERDPWPFENGSFDLVLCMELLEHLLLDPCFVFREAYRVLRPGGQLIVTTPNIASYEAVGRLWNLEAPYSFGIYSRHGAYGRHNREYAPLEVQAIGECCGFSTDLLTTRDVYLPHCDPDQIAARFQEPLPRPDLRRQNIFYRGIRQERPFGRYPTALFDFDAETHRAAITVTQLPEQLPVETWLQGSVVVRNLGTYTWTTEGESETWLGIMLLDRGGRVLIRDFRRVDLSGDVAPGEAIEVPVNVAGHGEPGEYLLRFDMVHERVCWFSDTRPSFLDFPIRFRIAQPTGAD